MKKPSPRPSILDIKAYVGGESKLLGQKQVIKLSSNEGALGASPKALQVYQECAASLHRYPDGSCEALRKTIANHYDLDKDRIVCGAGSDEIISPICRAYAGSGDEVLYSQHGFLMYPITAKSVGATPVSAMEKNLQSDVDALLEKVTERTKIVFLANPNNPAGTYLPLSEIRRLRAGLPSDVILVLDGAYAEYVAQKDYSCGVELVEETNNTVVTRTFSKIYVLGGLRLGWSYCPEEIADVLNRLRNPFNVSSIAQEVGIAALMDTSFTESVKAHNDIRQAWLSKELTDLGLSVVASVCNFILVRFQAQAGKDALSADHFLRSHGIIVRTMGSYGLPDSLRITIGQESEMKALREALEKFMAQS